MESHQILEYLINQDFGTTGNNNPRWGKSENHSSLVIDKRKNIFFWNSQNIIGDALTYLLKVRKLSKEQALKLLDDLKYRNNISIIKNDKDQTIIVHPKLVNVFFENGKKDRSYFYDRCLTDSTIDRFQLGKFNGYYTVPFFENGIFKNFQCRKDNPKKMFGYYKNVGPLLFNSDILKLTNKIFYTEGPIDTMVLIQNGLPAISSNCGGGFLRNWYSKFIRQKEIILLFDNDGAGNIESKRLAKFLGENRCRIYNFWDFSDKYDPVDFIRDSHNIDELMELIDKKGKYSFEL